MAEAPLADVERRATVVVGGGVAVGDHHLGKRQPVCDRPYSPGVLVADRVQHESLAVVEADPHRPLLPAKLVAVQRERRTVRLGDRQRRDVGAQCLARHQLRRVLTHRLRRVLGQLVLELEQLHRVEVDDRMQAGKCVRVRVTVRRAAVPDIGPPDSPARVLGWRDRRAVSPDVDQHQVHVGHAAAPQRFDHLRMLAQRNIALVVVGDGHRRMLARRKFRPRRDLIAVQRHRAPEGPAVSAIPADDVGNPRRCLGAAERALIGLVQVDRRKAPAVTGQMLAANGGRGGADLRSREWIQRMCRGHDGAGSYVSDATSCVAGSSSGSAGG